MKKQPRGGTLGPRLPQSSAPFSILPKLVEKKLETSEETPSCAVNQQGAPRNANGSLASAFKRN